MLERLFDPTLELQILAVAERSLAVSSDVGARAEGLAQDLLARSRLALTLRMGRPTAVSLLRGGGASVLGLDRGPRAVAGVRQFGPFALAPSVAGAPLGEVPQQLPGQRGRLTGHPRAGAPQGLLGLGRVGQGRGQQRRGQAAILLAGRMDQPAGVAGVGRAGRVDEQAQQALGLGQRWTAYSSWTSRVYSARRQIHAFAWSRRPIRRSTIALSMILWPLGAPRGASRR